MAFKNNAKTIFSVEFLIETIVPAIAFVVMGCIIIPLLLFGALIITVKNDPTIVLSKINFPLVNMQVETGPLILGLGASIIGLLFINLVYQSSINKIEFNLDDRTFWIVLVVVFIMVSAITIILNHNEVKDNIVGEWVFDSPNGQIKFAFNNDNTFNAFSPMGWVYGNWTKSPDQPLYNVIINSSTQSDYNMQIWYDRQSDMVYLDNITELYTGEIKVQYIMKRVIEPVL